MTKKQEEDIINLYNHGDPFRDIELQTGLSMATISRFIERAKIDGRVKARENNVKRPTDILYNDDGTVCCTYGTNKHCIYGSSHETMCNYYLMNGVGHRRGCDPSHCDKFLKGTPVDKRRRGAMRFNDKPYL